MGVIILEYPVIDRFLLYWVHEEIVICIFVRGIINSLIKLFNWFNRKAFIILMMNNWTKKFLSELIKFKVDGAVLSSEMIIWYFRYISCLKWTTLEWLYVQWSEDATFILSCKIKDISWIKCLRIQQNAYRLHYPRLHVQLEEMSSLFLHHRA